MIGQVGSDGGGRLESAVDLAEVVDAHDFPSFPHLPLRPSPNDAQFTLSELCIVRAARFVINRARSADEGSDADVPCRDRQKCQGSTTGAIWPHRLATAEAKGCQAE